MTHPLVEDNVYKAKPILVKALRFGVDVGRLRLGKPGNCQMSNRDGVECNIIIP